MKIKLLIGLVTIFTNSFSQNCYSNLIASQMQGDLNVLHSVWTSLHPGLYRYNTPQQIENYFDVLRAECNKPLDERKFYLLLSQLAQKIKCGHTYLNPLNLDRTTQKRFLPSSIIPFFFEVVEEGKIVITYNLTSQKEIERGDEIIAINSIPAKRIVDSLLTVSRSDGNNSTGKKIKNINETPDEANANSLFDIYFPLFFPFNGQTFKLTIKKFSGAAVKDFIIKATSLSERVAAYEERFGRIPDAERTWSYKNLDLQTAYMKFGTFAFWNSSFNETNFVDSIFNDVVNKGSIRNLIIDLRNNEGGDNTGNYILSYITHKKIGCDDPDRPCYRYLSIPDSLLPYLDTWDESFKRPKDPNRFSKNDMGLYELKITGDSCGVIEPKSNGFKGNLFLLTNAKNSSAAYEMARNFRTANLGKVIGEITGGSQQGINGGEFFFLKLPNSKFEIDLPLIYNYHANKPDRGISPDYEIKTTQRDIYYNKDTQLEFALSLISKSKELNNKTGMH